MTPINSFPFSIKYTLDVEINLLRSARYLLVEVYMERYIGEFYFIICLLYRRRSIQNKCHLKSPFFMTPTITKATRIFVYFCIIYFIVSLFLPRYFFGRGFFQYVLTTYPHRIQYRIQFNRIRFLFLFVSHKSQNVY